MTHSPTSSQISFGSPTPSTSPVGTYPSLSYPVLPHLLPVLQTSIWKPLPVILLALQTSLPAILLLPIIGLPAQATPSLSQLSNASTSTQMLWNSSSRKLKFPPNAR